MSELFGAASEAEGQEDRGRGEDGVRGRKKENQRVGVRERKIECLGKHAKEGNSRRAN